MLAETQLDLFQLPENNKSEEEKEKKKVNPPPPLRGFVGIGIGGDDQVVYQIELPEAHQMRCVGSTGNWLITVDKSRMIHLLNPFTRAQIDLPSQSTFETGFDDDGVGLTPEYHRDCLLKKVIISSTPSSSKDWIVMAIYHYHRKLAIARPGDVSWTTLETPLDYVIDIIFFKNQFYTVNCRGILMVCDIGDDVHSSKACVLTERLPKKTVQENMYLVELLGELLLVIKFVLDLDDREDEDNEEIKLPAYKTEKFEIYKLDFANKKWKEVNSLGEYCLFLGFNTSVSVRAVSGFLKKNCIYFTDDFTLGYRGNRIPGGSDMGVFDLEDKSIQPHYRGESTCYYSPPIWLIPTSLEK
ncbi:F-box skip23-like protein [Thalictrum thalictroides]|uniref:F-box skip23-like protein n=1 Tax=Thalictrum thalictroides TaxID=46969 RepID=A0A7J6WQ57_THATH|nr:F-box skip23-like protein [Thalictrum thalictroides]